MSSNSKESKLFGKIKDVWSHAEDGDRLCLGEVTEDSRSNGEVRLTLLDVFGQECKVILYGSTYVNLSSSVLLVLLPAEAEDSFYTALYSSVLDSEAYKDWKRDGIGILEGFASSIGVELECMYHFGMLSDSTSSQEPVITVEESPEGNNLIPLVSREQRSKEERSQAPKVRVNVTNKFAQRVLGNYALGRETLWLDPTLVDVVRDSLPALTPAALLQHMSQSIDEILVCWEDTAKKSVLECLGIERRYYLRDTLRALSEWLSGKATSNSVCNIVWATGLGKSFLAKLLVALVPDDRQVGVMTSSLLLVEQLCQRFSDVGKVVSHVSSDDLGDSVELNPFGQVTVFTHRSVSYSELSDSVASGAVGLLMPAVRPDLLIVDEMDTAYTKDQWEQVQAWAAQGTVVIAMSATRDHLVKGSMDVAGVSLPNKVYIAGNEYSIVRLGNDFYGPTIFSLDLGSAINEKLLRLPKYIRWQLPLSVNALMGGDADSDWQKVVEFVLKQIQHKEYLPYLTESDGSWKQMMFTTRSVDKSEELSKCLTGIGIDARTVSNRMTNEERRIVVDMFKSRQLVALLGSNVIGRGLDVRAKVLVRLNPRSSMQLTIQEIGRINRAVSINTDYGNSSSESLVVIDVLTPDWEGHVTADAAFAFEGLDPATVQGLLGELPLFERLRQSNGVLKPKLQRFWGKSLSTIYASFIKDFPENESCISLVQLRQYLRSLDGWDSTLTVSDTLNESDLAYVQSALISTLQAVQLEDDPEWLTYSDVSTYHNLAPYAEVMEGLMEIVDSFLDQESDLAIEFLVQKPVLQINTLPEAQSFFHVIVWRSYLTASDIIEEDQEFFV